MKRICLIAISALSLLVSCEKRLLDFKPDGLYEICSALIRDGVYDDHIDNYNGYARCQSYVDFHGDSFTAYEYAHVYKIDKDIIYKIVGDAEEPFFHASFDRAQTNAIDGKSAEYFIRCVNGKDFALSAQKGDGWSYLFKKVSSKSLENKLFSASENTRKNYNREVLSYSNI